MTMTIKSKCHTCKHIISERISIPEKGNRILTCKAFPEGIPTDIYLGVTSTHLRKREGQSGDFVFTSKSSYSRPSPYKTEEEQLQDIIEQEESIKLECLLELQNFIKDKLKIDFKWEKTIVVVTRKKFNFSSFMRLPRNEEKADCLFFVTKSGVVKKEFILKSRKAYKLLHKLLLLHNRLTHKRTLRLTLYSNGVSDFEYTDEYDGINPVMGEHPRYRILYNNNLDEELFKKWGKQSRNKKLKIISYEEAENFLKEIHKEYEEKDEILPLNEVHISLIFEQKGYLFLRSQVNKLKFLIRLRLMLICLQNFNN